MNRPLYKIIALASKPAPSSSAGRSARAKSIRAYADDAIKIQADAIRADGSPRCGTCGAKVDPFNSDEGYSYCCNDRIEYADEWAAGTSPTLWAAEHIFYRVASANIRLEDYGVKFDVIVDKVNDEREALTARAYRW